MCKRYNPKTKLEQIKTSKNNHVPSHSHIYHEYSSRFNKEKSNIYFLLLNIA